MNKRVAVGGPGPASCTSEFDWRSESRWAWDGREGRRRGAEACRKGLDGPFVFVLRYFIIKQRRKSKVPEQRNAVITGVNGKTGGRGWGEEMLCHFIRSLEVAF